MQPLRVVRGIYPEGFLESEEENNNWKLDSERSVAACSSVPSIFGSSAEFHISG